MKRERPSFHFTSILLFTISANVLADINPISYSANGIDITPLLSIEEKYDSNIIYSETDIKSSSISILSPSLQIGTSVGLNSYKFQAAAKAGFFEKSSNDNFLDGNIGGDIHHELSQRSLLDVESQYYREHDHRGTTYSEGRGQELFEPEKYHGYRTQINYTHGTEDSPARLILSSSLYSKKYRNYLDITKDRNLSFSSLGATFLYHIKPKTALLLELNHSIINYTQNSAALDSNENRFYVGVDWKATSITSGNIKGGLLQKNFSSSKRHDFNGFSWQIGINWNPLSYTHFSFETSGKTEENNGIGDYIESKSILGNWRHTWTEDVNSILESSITEYTYHPSGSRAGYGTLSAGVKYSLRRWLSINPKAEVHKRASQLPNHDFDKFVISMTFLVTL